MYISCIIDDSTNILTNVASTVSEQGFDGNNFTVNNFSKNVIIEDYLYTQSLTFFASGHATSYVFILFLFILFIIELTETFALF